MNMNLIKDPPSEFEELSDDSKARLLDWCNRIEPIKSFNDRHTSYGLKHIYEGSEFGEYVTNGQFKGAMLKCGFAVKDSYALNWVFNISEKSIKNLIKEKEDLRLNRR